MRNAGTILMYNCSGDKYSKLKQIFAMLRLRMRAVEPERYHVSLLDLSQGKGEPGEAAEPLGEPMLVFCYMSQALLNQVLEIIRLAKIPPINLKAILTEANQDWDSKQLYEELLKERESIAAQEEEKKAEGEKA